MNRGQVVSQRGGRTIVRLDDGQMLQVTNRVVRRFTPGTLVLVSTQAGRPAVVSSER